MYLFWWITHIFLSLPSLLSLVQSLTCDKEKQYAWPQSVSQWCCNKCPPGQYMVRRCTGQNSPTQCDDCSNGYYSDSYNIDSSCKSCNGCSMSELEYVSRCSNKRNDVCSCKQGYRCRGSGTCLDCEENPSPTTPIMPATVSNHSVPGIPNHRAEPVTEPGTGPSTKPNQDDSKWLPVCVTAVCVCVLLTCLVAISKLKPVLRWIGSTNSFWSSKKMTPANQSTAEEKVPMPVQEVCGKPELLLDV
ncbi:CD27 antigen [Coregonus clupeaformis]|uniref:CD27 antigen n=1 Tax=Coregonus clupeaformis TaxID=59861 RepID=UPI001BE0DCFB|nr:CD27 antigen [Coregonus clupeaformis]